MNLLIIGVKLKVKMAVDLGKNYMLKHSVNYRTLQVFETCEVLF